MVFKVASSFIFKIFTFKQGSLLLFSGSVSAFFLHYISMLVEDTDPKAIVIPVVLQFVAFFIFMCFTIVDMVTGIQLSYYKSKCPERLKKLKETDPDGEHIHKVIKSYKLWRTLWKVLGIKLLTIMIMLLSIFLEIVDFHYGYWASIWFLTVVWIMANGFEFYSIGENLINRHNKKPRIFVFWDSILDAVQKKAIRKIDNSFNILDDDTEKDKSK